MRVLAFAYACDPDHGSEPGAGWAWARMLARIGETWVITRENNRGPIERRLTSTPEAANLHFVYVDLPRWSRFWKKGGRGVRLYYTLWQLAAARRGRALARQESFDLIWHLTFANLWLGSAAPLVGRPFMFGPVGGGVGIPWRFLESMGFRGRVFELVRGLGRTFGRYLNPLTQLSLWKADLILVNNKETQRWLPTRALSRSALFPHTVVDDPNLERIEGLLLDSDDRPDRASTALFAARLVPLKGADLAIQALGKTDRWRLLICGAGPEELRLQQLVSDLNLGSRVEFLGWQPRDHVIDLMASSDAFLFPSLHDEAPLAVAEARTSGLPVICLDRGGPPEVAGPLGIVVSASTADAAVDGLSAALKRVRQRPHPREVDRFLTLNETSTRLRLLLEQRGLLTVEETDAP
jgi:glycosyltransferase involved in cell wall biosynthesis